MNADEAVRAHLDALTRQYEEQRILRRVRRLEVMVQVLLLSVLTLSFVAACS